MTAPTIPSLRILRLITRTHIALYRLTGGVIGGFLGNAPNLLLTTTGRRSGKQFTTPLLFLPDGENLVIVASFGGQPKDPQWWQNLQANPRAKVEVGTHRWDVVAEKADEETKARLWPVFCRYYPGYIEYQKRTERVIPLVILKTQ